MSWRGRVGLPIGPPILARRPAARAEESPRRFNNTATPRAWSGKAFSRSASAAGPRPRMSVLGGRRSDHATSSIEGSLSQRHNKPNTAGPAVFLTLGGFLPACIAGTENPPANIRKTKSEKTKAKISRKEPSRTRMPPSRSWPDGRWHEAASQAQRILRECAASCL